MIALNFIAAIERLRLMESDFHLKWGFCSQPGQSRQAGHGQKRTLTIARFRPISAFNQHQLWVVSCADTVVAASKPSNAKADT
jgi:hypothetical protein